MNTFLAEAYGTAAPTQEPSEQEKVAAAYEFLDKLATADGVDISKLNDADVEKVANFYFTKLAEEEAAPPAEKKEEEKKEDKKEDKAPPAEEKKDGLPPQFSDNEKQAMAEMGEADFLGRQMAHAFVNELDTIQKTAMAAQAEAAAEQQIPEPLLKLAEARALEFLQEKVAEGALCKCGDPACKGECEEKEEPAAAETKEASADASQIDAIAAQMLAQSGYGHLLQQVGRHT
jgi:transcriptional regulator with XRE-family HTH domain